MYEWSGEDLMIRDALRGFLDTEVRPHIDELETGVLPPYDIAPQMYATFGVDQMAREGLEKELEAEASGERRPSATGAGGWLRARSFSSTQNSQAGACESSLHSVSGSSPPAPFARREPSRRRSAGSPSWSRWRRSARGVRKAR